MVPENNSLLTSDDPAHVRLYFLRPLTMNVTVRRNLFLGARIQSPGVGGDAALRRLCGKTSVCLSQRLWRHAFLRLGCPQAFSLAGYDPFVGSTC